MGIADCPSVPAPGTGHERVRGTVGSATLGLLAIVLSYTAGMFIETSSSLPIPAPVGGFFVLLLLISLLPHQLSDRVVVPTAERAVSFIPFLLVPTAVGVMTYFQEIANNAPALVVSLIGGWVAALSVTALVARFLSARL